MRGIISYIIIIIIVNDKIYFLKFMKAQSIALKNHLHANTYHKKREVKAMKVGIPKSIDEAFLMRKKEIYIINNE